MTAMTANAFPLCIWPSDRRLGKHRVLAIRQLRVEDGGTSPGVFMRAIVPPTLRPPFGRYAHGTFVPSGAEWVFTSGQLPVRPDDSVPDGALDQARLCFANCAAILEDAGMGAADVVHISAFVTDRAHMASYMAARDEWLAGLDRRPASTLVIVAGFTRPEFLVEVEMTAARTPR
jgi:enamine deaminase RidA (YjgF/YER057c/UK114 family)